MQGCAVFERVGRAGRGEPVSRGRSFRPDDAGFAENLTFPVQRAFRACYVHRNRVPVNGVLRCAGLAREHEDGCAVFRYVGGIAVRLKGIVSGFTTGIKQPRLAEDRCAAGIR